MKIFFPDERKKGFKNIYLRFVFDGEIEESEEGGLAGLHGITPEHIDERRHGRGELPAKPVGGLGEPPDLSRRLDLRTRVVRLDELQGVADRRDPSRGVVRVGIRGNDFHIQVPA